MAENCQIKFALNISSDKSETFSGTSSTITIQNGPDAGQTVPHVHD